MVDVLYEGSADGPHHWIRFRPGDHENRHHPLEGPPCRVDFGAITSGSASGWEVVNNSGLGFLVRVFDPKIKESEGNPMWSGLTSCVIDIDIDSSGSGVEARVANMLW